MSFLPRWGRAPTLRGDLCVIDFAEVGKGPPAYGGDLCMDDLVEVGEGSKHGYVC